MSKQIDPGEGYELLEIGDEMVAGDEFRHRSGGEWAPTGVIIHGLKYSNSNYSVRRKITATKCGCGKHIIPPGADPYAAHRRHLVAESRAPISARQIQALIGHTGSPVGPDECGKVEALRMVLDAEYAAAVSEEMRARTESRNVVEIQHEDFV